MKNKEKLGKRVRRALELDQILPDRDMLEMRGNEELTVRECERILSYGEREIRLSLREYVLTICGEGLFSSSFAGRTVRVDGAISSLTFERRGRRK